MPKPIILPIMSVADSAAEDNLLGQKPTQSPTPSRLLSGGSGFGGAAIITVGFTLLSRVIGMVRDMVIAAEFGRSFKTDAYNAAFTIPDLLMYLIAGGAIASTFVPVFTKYLHLGDEENASKTFSTVATVIAIVASALIVIGELFAPTLVVLLNPVNPLKPEPAAYYPLATEMTRILLPAQFFFMIGSLMMGSLNARRNFMIPTMGPVIYNLGIIFGAVFLRGLGIYGLTWGALVGAFIGNFALQAFHVAKTPLKFKLSLDLRHPGVRQVWSLILPVILGASLPNVDQMINKSYSALLGEGAQTAIMNAVRVMLIPVGVFAQAMGIAILPTLSAHFSSGDKVELRRAIVKGLKSVLFISIPISVLMYIMAEPVIAVLYQHGKYHYMDTLATAGALRLYAVGIFAWSAQAILTRSFYAIGDSRTPVISGTIMTIVFIGLNWIVVHETDWSISGLAAMTSVAATLHAVVMLYILNLRVGKIADFPLGISCVKTALATLGLMIVCVPLHNALVPIFRIDVHSLNALPQILITSTLGAITFCGLAYIMNMSEVNVVINLAARLVGKNRS